MAASSAGMSDLDHYSEFCNFSYLGGACGPSQHYTSPNNNFYRISECTKDTSIHLRRLNSTENSCVDDFPEGLLILYRSGMFSVDIASTYLRICPKHRDIYGIYWHNNRTKCQFQDHPTSSKAKADRGSSPMLCKQIWMCTRQVIPVGAGNNFKGKVYVHLII